MPRIIPWKLKEFKTKQNPIIMESNIFCLNFCSITYYSGMQLNVKSNYVGNQINVTKQK